LKNTVKILYVLLMFFILSIPIIAEEFTLVTLNLSGVSSSYGKLSTSDLDNDGLIELLVGYQGGIYVDLYEQSSYSSLHFIENHDWYLEVYPDDNANQTVTDIDGDGLLDIIVTYRISPNSKMYRYEQVSENSFDIIEITDSFANINIDYSPNLSPFFFDIDNDNKLDLLLGHNNGQIYHYEQNSVNSPDFTFVTSNFSNIDVGRNADLEILDYNKDGLLDMFIGNLNGFIAHYVQDSQNSYTFNLVNSTYIYINAGEASPSFTDLDNDNYPDLLIGNHTNNTQHWEIRASSSTNQVTSIGATSAICGVNVGGSTALNYTACGVCWNTSSNPTISDFTTNDGTTQGNFSSTMTDLYPGQTYYVRGYATDQYNTTYGDQKTFITFTPTVITTEISNVTETSAISGGFDIDSGGSTITSKGVCWATTQNPTISDSHTSDGSGLNDFSSTITDLTEGTMYFVRSFITYPQSINYGNQISFTTYKKPSVTTSDVTSVSYASSQGSGEVTESGIPEFTSKGFCWSTSPNASISDYSVEDNSVAGDINIELSGLSAGVLYYARAYATNVAGTAYGEELSFITSSSSVAFYSGYSLEFDGNDEHLIVGNDPTLPLGNEVTIEAWIKPIDLSTRQGIFSTRANNDAGSFQVEVGPGTGSNRLLVSGVGTWVAQSEDNALLENEWNHIAYTRSGTGSGTHKLYVNGIEQTLLSDANYTFIDNSEDFLIASGTNGGQLFEGVIEELKIWNTTRTGSEIREYMHVPLDGDETGLISYIQCNQGYGQIAPSSLKGHGGFLQNMNDTNWKLSAIPFFMGETNSQTESNGLVEFTDTRVSMNFSAHNNAEITVSYLGNSPNVQPNNSDTIFNARYWVINRSENSPFEADLTFTVTSGLPNGLESKPEMVKLYTRETYSDSDWILLAEASAVNAAQNQATFSNITEFSQFYIGIESPKVTLVKTPDEFIYVDDALDYTNFGSNSQYVFEDINSNGLLDLLVGTYDGKIKHFEQDNVDPSNFNIITNDFNVIYVIENADPTLTDIDNDGLLDLVIGNSLGSLVHYEQSSLNSFTFLQISGAISTISVNSYASPNFTDLENDGLLDLLIGTGSGSIVRYEQMTLNSSSFALVSSNFNSISTVSNAKPEVTDFDSDGILDLVIGKPDGTLSYYKQNSQSSTSFTLITEKFSQIDESLGVAPSFWDLDNDLLLDMIVTQTDGANFHYEQDEISEIDFGEIFVGDSELESYLVRAENLISDLQVSVSFSEEFYVSIAEESGFVNDLALSPTNGILNQTVFVKYLPPEYDEYFGLINHSSELNYYSDIILYGISKQINPYPETGISFTESDDYLNFGNDNSLNIASEITLEMWVKVDSSGSNMNLLKKGNIRLLHWDAVYEGSSGKGFQLNLPGPETGWWEFGYTLNYDEWNHVAWTFGSSGELKAYINGENVRTDTFPGNITLNTDDLIFSTSTADDPYNGRVDEIRLWNTVRSEADIKENMHIPLKGFENGLVSYWQLNDGFGDNAVDIISNNNATLENLSNGAWIISEIPFGSGYSDSQIISGSEQYDFVDTDCNITTDTSYNNIPITVSKINIEPNQLPEYANTVFYNQYWVIHKYSDESFTSDLNFIISEDLTMDDENNPTQLKLYSRDSNGTGNWHIVASASDVDAALNSITFDDISGFSQFILGRKIPPDNFIGNCLDFAGVDDYVDCGNDTSLDISNAFSFEAWIYYQGGESYPRVIDKYPAPSIYINESNNLLGWYGEVDDSSLDFTFPNTEILRNEWSHIAVTFDGSNIKSYLNGDLKDTEAHSGLLSVTTNDLIIGNNISTSRTFSGKLEEIRLWNTARSDAEIRENLHLPLTGAENGLVSYWQFNESDGLTANDIVSGNSGTLTNMDDSDWIDSTIPFGGGNSNTQTENSGVVDFTETGLSMFFNSHESAEITVTKIDTTANLNPSEPDTIFDSQYWVVNRFGSGTFDADLTFTITEDLTVSDETNPEQIVLYTRSSTADTNWVYLSDAGSVNASNDEATFDGITEFSQFIIGRYIVNLDIPQNVTIETNGTQLQITWDEVSGANSYKIYASDSPDGIFTHVTASGNFGTARNLGFISKENDLSVRTRSNEISHYREDNNSRTTQIWTSDINGVEKKFYYVIASTDDVRFNASDLPKNSKIISNKVDTSRKIVQYPKRKSYQKKK
jgi:Concanavalin A-like lectin/glucanases superfamily/FG-GAP-like repeat